MIKKDNITPEHIELFDKILDYLDGTIEVHPNKNRNKDFFSEVLGIDKTVAEDALYKMLELGKEFGILDAYKYSYGQWIFQGIHKIDCANFKKAGGFKIYFTNDKNMGNQIFKNLSQTQSQHQSVEITIIMEAIQNELKVEQIEELKKILKDSEEGKKKQNLKDKIIGFGSDVAASLLANILTKTLIG